MDSTSEVSIIKGLNSEYSMQRLHRIFEANLNSSNCGNQPAVIFSSGIDDDSKLTYNQLNHGANRLAAALIDQINTHKLKPNPDGDWIIAVCMPPSNEAIMTLLAILKMGCAYLPIDTTFPRIRVDHILQDANPTIVIYDSNAVESSLFTSTANYSFAECEIFSKNYDSINISDDRMLQSGTNNPLALVLYTSGSPGVPKGVRLPHAAIMNRLTWQWDTFPYSSTERVCMFKTALTFADSVPEIWSPLLTKRAVLVLPKRVTKDPTQLVAILQKYEIERLVLVPTLLKSLLFYLSLEHDTNLLTKLKLWICSGESLPVSLANEFYDYFPEHEYSLCNFYGSTEITGDVTFFVCRGKDQLRNYTTVPIGYPILNTTIYLLDEGKKPVKLGETEHSRMYRTGDYASVQKDGFIHFEGRTDSQVKIRGHRVDLIEIEKYLLEIVGVEKSVVLCHHAGQMDQAIISFACLDSTSELNEFQLEQKLRNTLPEYMIPKVIIIDKMPLLSNGKVDRQTLLKLYENKHGDGITTPSNCQVTKTNRKFISNYMISGNEPSIEYNFDGVTQSQMKSAKALFEKIGEAVGRTTRASISLESNFYALSGNSLNSIFTIAKLRDRGYHINITEFISAKNMRKILECMTANERNHEKNVELNYIKGTYTAVLLKMEHKKEAIHVIANSFMEKGVLKESLKPNIKYSDNVDFLNDIWQQLVEMAYSFVIKDNNNRIVGTALAYDPNNKPEFSSPIDGPISKINILKFLALLEKPILNRLPKDKPIMYSYLIGTHECLNTKENVAAVTFMESEVIQLAKIRNCSGIITTNLSALTQQLARNVFGYKTMVDYQINQYISNGIKPFISLPDSCRAIVQWKKL